MKVIKSKTTLKLTEEEKVAIDKMIEFTISLASQEGCKCSDCDCCPLVIFCGHDFTHEIVVKKLEEFLNEGD